MGLREERRIRYARIAENRDCEELVLRFAEMLLSNSKTKSEAGIEKVVFALKLVADGIKTRRYKPEQK